MKNIFLIIAIGLFPVMLYGQTKWEVTSGSVSFKIKNAGVTVTGRFSGLKASMVFSPDKLPASSLKGSVDAATIKTGIDKRDKDLQEEKFFNTGKYKEIEIASVKLYKKGAMYAGLFDITIKGVTRQVEIPFSFIQNGSQAEFKGDFPINRRDFGVGEKSMIMADDLNVSIDIKAKSGM